MGRKLAKSKAAELILRALKTIGMTDQSAAIEDLELEFWWKSWRPAGGLTWRNGPFKVSRSSGRG